MKKLGLYENIQNEKDIENILISYNITNWTINSEGLVDVDGDVNLSGEHIIKIPLKFGKVTGYFDCRFNQLTNLKGSPIEVGGDFYCNSNKLKSLEGGPRYVGGYFACYNNQIASLEGAPDFVGGDFHCLNNPIYNIWKLFDDYSKIELFNYYDIVRELDEKPAIVLSRLNQFLEDIGKPPVKNVTGYINIQNKLNYKI